MLSALAVAANQNLHPLAAMLIGTIVGIGCGAIVGLLVSKGRVLPIIASLGMMNVYRGLTYMASGGAWVSAHQMPESFKRIATGRILGINTLIFIAIIIYIIAFYFVNYTRTGRQIYAVGSDPESAKVSGINTSRVLFLVYSIMGALAGLAGVLWVSKFASAQGDTATGYEMSVIAACVLGGVSMAGGSGKISGIIMGSILLGIINNALPLIRFLLLAAVYTRIDHTIVHVSQHPDQTACRQTKSFEEENLIWKSVTLLVIRNSASKSFLPVGMDAGPDTAGYTHNKCQSFALLPESEAVGKCNGNLHG